MSLSGHINRGAIAAAAAILVVQLFVPPVIGLANSGDFGKVIGVFGFGTPDENAFKFAPVTYTFEPKYRYSMGFVSSEHILTAAAVGLDAVFHGDRTFDLRWIGFVHGALALLALWLCPRRPVVVTLLILLIFADVGYVSVMNSFFMDAAAYVFFLLTIVFYLRRQGVWMLMACVLLITSKTPHAVVAIPAAALFLVEGARLGLDRWNARLAAATALVAAVFSWNAAGPNLHTDAAFNVIFWRLLPASSNVSRDLKLLGLNESYRPSIGKHAYVTSVAIEDPAFRAEFQRRTSHVRIGWLYLHHPSWIWRDLRASLAEAGSQRPAMGNFDSKYGRPEYSQSRSFALWSDLKSRMFVHEGGRYLAAIVLLIVAALALAWRSEARTGIITLIAILVLELLAAVFGDVLDIARHFFLFHALEDVLLVATVAMIGAARYY